MTQKLQDRLLSVIANRCPKHFRALHGFPPIDPAAELKRLGDSEYCDGLVVLSECIAYVDRHVADVDFDLYLADQLAWFIRGSIASVDRDHLADELAVRCARIINRFDGITNTLPFPLGLRLLSEPKTGANTKLDDVLNCFADPRIGPDNRFFTSLFTTWLLPRSEAHSQTVFDFLVRVRLLPGTHRLFSTPAVLAAAFDPSCVRLHFSKCSSAMSKKLDEDAWAEVSAFVDHLH